MSSVDPDHEIAARSVPPLLGRTSTGTDLTAGVLHRGDAAERPMTGPSTTDVEVGLRRSNEAMPGQAGQDANADTAPDHAPGLGVPVRLRDVSEMARIVVTRSNEARVILNDRLRAFLRASLLRLRSHAERGHAILSFAPSGTPFLCERGRPGRSALDDLEDAIMALVPATSRRSRFGHGFLPGIRYPAPQSVRQQGSKGLDRGFRFRPTGVVRVGLHEPHDPVAVDHEPRRDRQAP